MAFSINSLPASSSSNTISCPDGKKSLFLLKKITELTKLGCKNLNDNVLNSTAGDLINTYLTLFSSVSTIKLYSFIYVLNSSFKMHGFYNFY